MEDMYHTEHKSKLTMPLAEHRKKMVEHAYKHYTLPEYKIWATDTCIEFAQQLSRINSEKCDKEELIKAMLMTEDICCMLRMLLHKDEAMIETIATDIYCEFADMLKAHGVAVEGCTSYVAPTKTASIHNPGVATNSLK
jgi:hypothetical protein